MDVGDLEIVRPMWQTSWRTASVRYSLAGVVERVIERVFAVWTVECYGYCDYGIAAAKTLGFECCGIVAEVGMMSM